MNKEEAMKILKDFHDKSALFSVRTALDTIFPELCESEDEKIRKEIISFIQDHIDEINLQVSGDYDTRDKEDIALQEWCKKAIAWLEKQKEYESTDFEYVLDRTDCGDLTSALDKYSEEAIINMCHAWYDKGIELERKSWLEKQCYTKKDVDDAYLKGICYTKHELEKQGEQESADKHEPKFNVGDWITNGDYTWKVIKVEQFDYILQSQDGNIVDDTISHVDEQFHSFTIKDAKDGDVLIDKSGSREGLFIFKETKPSDIKTDVLNNPLTVLGYCGIGGAGFTKGSGWGDTANCTYYPATKEQRDQLEKAMANAGYTFNFEKKELKKIKQKPQRMVSAEAKEALYDKPTDEEMKELLRTEYEKGRADTIAEMEKDWSEEDDVMINKLLAVVKLYYDRSGDDLDKQSCISFLKSLKDKVQPQPKQEWSEEDEIARKALINLVEMYYGGCIDKTEKKRLLNLLKSLRPQNTWKPSEEQMSTLNLIISDYYHACTKECDKKAIVLKSILEQLKQL